MRCIGFSENLVSWFESYFSGRTFKVNIDKKFWIQEILLAAFSKDLILGPFLFLLYVNDMPKAVRCDLILYAEDTCLTFQYNNVKIIEDQLLKLNLSSLCDWFIDNKLSINLGEDKTKSILFGTKFNIKQAEPLNIVYGNVKIKQYTKVTRGDSEVGAGGTPPLPYFLQLLVYLFFFFAITLKHCKLCYLKLN